MLATTASASARVFAITVIPLLVIAPLLALVLWASLWQALRFSCGTVPRLGELAAWSLLPLGVSGLIGAVVSGVVGIAVRLGPAEAGGLLQEAAELLQGIVFIVASAASLWLVFASLKSLAPARAVGGTVSFGLALVLFYAIGGVLVARWSAA